MNAEVEVRTAHIAVVCANKHGRRLEPLGRYFQWHIEGAYGAFSMRSHERLCTMHESACDAEAYLRDKRGTRIVMFVSHTDMKQAKRLAKGGQRTVIFVGIDERCRLEKEREEGKENVPRELRIFWRGILMTPEWLKALIA